MHRMSFSDHTDSPFSPSAITRRKAPALVRKFLPPPATLLDVGAHGGEFAATMARNGYSVTALDAEPRGSFQPFISADANGAWPLASGSFDAVTAWQVLEHLENPHHFFREARRVLAKDGLLFLSLPNPYSAKNRIQFFLTGDFYRYRENSFHITPFIRSSFARAYAPHFTLHKDGYSEMHKKRIPRLLPFLKKSSTFRMLFGESYFAVLQKVN